MHSSYRLWIAVIGCCTVGRLLAAESTAELSGYQTVQTAATAKVSDSVGRIGQTGYLGVSVERDGNGRLVVEAVQPDSPAARAGLKKGDVVTRVGDETVRTSDAFREWLQTRGPGDAVKLSVSRDDKPLELTATLAATSRPMRLSSGARAYLGVQFSEAPEGVRVDRVTSDSPAAAAGFRDGDVIVKIEGREFKEATRVSDLIATKKPGDVLKFDVLREGKDVELKATLAEDRRRGAPAARTAGPAAPWSKDVFRLAVVLFEFPDVKHNDKVTLKDWESLLFSEGKYTGSNATGQPVHGSLCDYLLEQSCGKLRLQGKVFDWVELSKKRGDYVQGSGTSNKTAPLLEAMTKVTGRDGKDAFKDYDGLLFVYAGERPRTNAGAVYYPHSGELVQENRRRPYLLATEGASRMATVGDFVKTLGHVLGLPDLGPQPGDAGSEGLGPWCAMSAPTAGSRPQHYCAWVKEKMGWLKPTVIDPTVKQKLILSPIVGSATECFKVLVRPDGSEYLLLENRTKKGFDADLPGEGLLIWRVVNGRPVLEESHGIEGPSGPLSQLSAVPYPSRANTAFTPYTTPSSRSPLGGGLPVHLTEIRRLPDGRVTLHVGYEYR